MSFFSSHPQPEWFLNFMQAMNIIFLITCLSVAASHNHKGQYAPSFLRDSVEKVINYPFQIKPAETSGRKKSSDRDVFLEGGKKSYLMEYVFKSFGSKNLPLRESVESLPLPPLTEEERAFSGWLPLREAVERRPTKKRNLFGSGDVQSAPGRMGESKSYASGNNRSPHFRYDRNYDNTWSIFNKNVEGRIGKLLTSGAFNGVGSFDRTMKAKDEKNYESRSRGTGFEEERERMVCYIQGWANHRRDPMKFNLINIDPFACTHIIYMYASIDPHTFNVEAQNEEHDVVQGGYRSIVGLKRMNSRLKVLISIAGWSTGDSKFSKMASSAIRRQKFIKSVAKFLDSYKFDGIDLHWEFPGAEDLGGDRNDREHFSLLINELFEVFLLKNWVLSASVSPSRFRIEDGYNVKEIARNLDLINVLAFDLHSERDDVADHHSPLYRRKHDQGLDIFYNADYAIQYWIKKGAPKEKLMLGIPFFGRTFTLSDPQKWLPGSRVRGAGKEGPFTQNKGFLAYFEICEMLKRENWMVNADSIGSPYAVKTDQWMGYDNVFSVSKKANYAKKQGLGGVALYAIDLDDYRGTCGVKWPLLSAVKNAFLKSDDQGTLSSFSRRSGFPVTPIAGSRIMTLEKKKCTGQYYAVDPNDCGVYHHCDRGWQTSYVCPDSFHFDSTLKLCNSQEKAGCIGRKYTRSKEVRHDNKFKIVCYFSNWAWYRRGNGKFVPENIDPRLCTHIVYAYASLDPNDLEIKPFDVTADINNNFYDRVTRLHDLRNGNKKTAVLLALGGWTDSAGNKYSKLISDKSAVRNFIESCLAFLKKYKFQGLHFDWVYPVCWQSDCNKGPQSDMRNYVLFLTELSKEFKKQNPPLILASGISGYREVIDVGYDIANISEVVDFMSVMTYDYHGAWEKRTGHISPLYHRNGDSFPRFNTNYTMEYLAAKGADRSKLLVGIPFYGQSFTLKDENQNGYGAPAEGPGTPGEFTKQPGMLAYYEICNRIRNKKWKVNREAQGATRPFAFKNSQWVGYDDIKSVKEKATYIKNMGYGGAMAWSIDLDDFNNQCCQGSFPLLAAIGRALGHVKQDEPAMLNCTRPTSPVTPPPPTTSTGVDSGIHPDHENIHTTWPTGTEPSSTGLTTEPEMMWKPNITTTRNPWWGTVTTTEKPSNIFKPTTDLISAEMTSTTLMCQPGTYYSDQNNCNAYYRCILGELQKQYCIVGLHWNSENNICDWPENAKCDKDYYLPKPITTPTTQITDGWWASSTVPSDTLWSATSGVASEATTMATSTAGCINGAYSPVEGSCSLFRICVNNLTITQSCAPGLYWNQKKHICDWSHKVPCISNVNKLSNTMNIDVDILTQSCEEGTYANYPGNCNRYLTCVWGTYAVFSCAPGLHWNNEQTLCDWPNRAKCDFPKPTPGETTKQPEIPQPEDENELTEEGGTVISQPPTKPSEEAPPTPIGGYFKIVCYFTNWAWYRQGIGKYPPENINAKLCTHIVYGFAVLDYENLIIKPHDSWADIDNKFYERVVAYKKKGVKVTLAIGGWNDSQGNKYSRLVNNSLFRRKFISHVIQFLQKYNFDGLDLDWEYPKCWQVDCSKGPESDKSAFASFIKELHEAFKPHDFILSAAVSPNKMVIDAGYDVAALGRYLDWIAVMTYDYHGHWDKKTGHVAPLYRHEDDDFYFFNANYSINYWISEGVPRRKIVMGMPLYGQSFRLSNPNSNGLNAKALGPGRAGDYTKAAGFLSYYEICDRIKLKGWKVVRDEKMRMGPYAYKEDQWVSFDDMEIIRMKSEYIKKMNLGGGMIWALDLDDFSNVCGTGNYPLLSTIRNILGRVPNETETFTTIFPSVSTKNLSTSHINLPEGNVPFMTTTPINERPGSTLSGTQMKPTTWKPPSEEDFKVVCYFTNWAWYRQGLGKFLPNDIDPSLCTHIIYGFAVLDGEQGIIKPHDTWADFENKFYDKVTQFKKKGIKVLIAIGGWNDSAGDKYSRLVNNKSARTKFINHVIEFIKKHNFDGLDLDWEYPKCWQVNCKIGPDSDKTAFAAFVKELKAAFEPRSLLLSAAVSPSKRVIDAGYDVSTLSQHLDWISVMTYDFHGQWDKKTGHVAPMYLHADDVDVTFHANFSINYWISEGADRKKIVMGLPMYGQSFSLTQAYDNGLNAAAYGGGEAGEFTRARGFLSYYEICHNIREKKWKIVRDIKGRMGPYAFSKDQWVSFDDQDMIKHKAEYIRYMGLGGGMIWALDLDDFRNRCQCESYPLLKTLNRILRNYPGPQPVCVLDGKENEIIPQRPGFGETPPSGPEVNFEPTTPTGDSQRPTYKPVTTRPSTGPKPPPTTPSEIPPNPSPTDTSDCKGQIFMAHFNCNKYYMCLHGNLKEMNCPPGLHWNTDHCDWPENSNCKSSVTLSSSTTPIIDSMTISQNPTFTSTTIKQPTSTSPVAMTETATIQETSTDSATTAANNYKVVCYFTNWAWYRPGLGRYTPENIDYKLCTHIAYGFAVLDPNSFTIKPHDSWADIDNEFYLKVTSLKKKGIKVLIAIGGWNDSLGNKYSKLVGSPRLRKKFIDTTIKFIEKHNFDGLDLDWEYPKCWQVNCEAGPTEDKENFATLVEELSKEFKPKGWLLSSAVSPSKVVIDLGYEVAKLSRYFDYISVMTYDFHGHWDKMTGHVAPLYYYPGDTYDYFNGNFSINYWLEKGADKKKIIMGMPLYGQSFRLQNGNNHGLNAPSSGPGQPGQFTRAEGFLSFYEICEYVRNQGWEVTRDPLGRIGPFAYKENQWVSYDDVSEIRRKSQFIKQMGLGGGMIWALDLDDFRNRCGCGNHPLLKTLNRELRGIGGENTDCT